MAAEKDGWRAAEQFFLEENDGDDDEGAGGNNIYSGGNGSSSSSDENGDEEEGGHHQGSFSDASASQQWPQSYRVTADSYTIIASPSFGFLRLGSSAIYSSFDDRSKNSSDLDGKSPLLSDQERIHRRKT